MLFYSTNSNIKTVCQIRSDKCAERKVFYEVKRANGGSLNGKVEYTAMYSTLKSAIKAAKQICLEEEAYCKNNPHAWHEGIVSKVTVNGYGDEIKREVIPLF